MKNRGKIFVAFLVLLFSSINLSFSESSVGLKPYFLSKSKTEGNVNFENSSESGKRATVEKVDRMFWKISGIDKKGKPSTVYLLGTIHVGDERLFPLPESITSAFNNADRVAAEISMDDMENIQSEIAGFMGKSYLRANGRNVLDYLTDEEKHLLEDLVGNENLYALASFEPWVLMLATSNGEYSQVGMTGTSGIDLTLMEWLEEEDRSWEGMDTLQTQLNILAFGDYDQQLYMLKESLASMSDSTKSANESDYLKTIYEAYLDDDVDTVNELLKSELENEDVSPEMEQYVNDYHKALLDDRNSAWAKKIDKWIKEGGSTFIFAGCAHFIGEHSVFYYLKENNTIE